MARTQELPGTLPRAFLGRPVEAENGRDSVTLLMNPVDVPTQATLRQEDENHPPTQTEIPRNEPACIPPTVSGSDLRAAD